MALIRSVSGIRGIFGSHLTPENLVTYAAAFGSWLNGGTVAVGRDTRTTGQICEDIVTATLQSVGCNVIKTGVAPTPTIAMAVLHHQADGGIVLTASHNPAEWNALKLMNSRSEILDEKQGQEVLEIADSGRFSYVNYSEIGEVTVDDEALLNHIQSILDLPYIDPDMIAGAGFTVAIDAVNGAGSHSMPLLLEKLGVKVHKLNCTPDGLFPHNPEPLPEHLGEIRSFIREHDCDLGLVTDPDVDRLALLDEKGDLFGEENTQVAAFDFMLSDNPGPVATNLSSSRAADDIAESHGQICHRSAVGEIHVVRKMQEVGAVIGGEGNGGVINPDLHYGRDALAGAAMFLQLLANRKISASDYRKSLPSRQIIKEKMSLDELGMDADDLLALIREGYAEHQPNTIDGVKIDLEEGWVHFRKSNTEPIVRVYAEADTEQEARQLSEQLISRIQQETQR